MAEPILTGHVQVPRELQHHPDATPYTIAAYVALRGRAFNGQQLATASLQTLADEAGHMSPKQMSREVDKLALMGWVIEETRAGYHNRTGSYRVRTDSPNSALNADSQSSIRPRMETDSPVNADSQSTEVEEGSKELRTPSKEGADSTTSRRRPQRAIPDDFALTPSMRSWYANKRINGDIERRTEQFIAWHGSKDTRHANWEKAWQNWMLKPDYGSNGKTNAAVTTHAGAHNDPMYSDPNRNRF